MSTKKETTFCTHKGYNTVAPCDDSCFSTKKEKCCERCLSTNGWMKGECFNGDCHCHQSESIDLDEIDNKITDLVQRLPFEKRGEIWTLIHEYRKQAITTAVAKAGKKAYAEGFEDGCKAH